MKETITRHNPAEKRGLGMVFLGMQGPGNVTDSTGILEILADQNEAINDLRRRVSILETPWYVRAWLFMKRFIPFSGRGWK
jgi:hypothetical protein